MGSMTSKDALLYLVARVMGDEIDFAASIAGDLLRQPQAFNSGQYKLLEDIAAFLAAWRENAPSATPWPAYIQTVGSLLNNSLFDEAIAFNRKYGPQCVRDTGQWIAVARRMLESCFGRASVLKEADDLFMLALASAPETAEAWHQLAIARNCRGKSTDALALLRRAIRLDPTACAPYRTYTECLLHTYAFADALKALRIALALAPHESAWRAECVTLSETVTTAKKARKPSRQPQKWPQQVADMTDIKAVMRSHIVNGYEKKEIISRNDVVMTIGSCFAANVAIALKKRNVRAFNIALGEDVNNTYSNKEFINWALRDGEAPIDNDYSHLAAGERDDIARIIKSAKVIIYTLGVAPAFFRVADGKMVLPRPIEARKNIDSGKYVFRTTSVEENIANINDIMAMVRDVNPDVHFVFSVSPVPLTASFEYESIIMADCVSKSTLRVAIDSLLKRSADPKLFYWPSFEVVRWLGGYSGGAFGEEDGSPHHVSERYVDAIMEVFTDIFGPSA